MNLNNLNIDISLKNKYSSRRNLYERFVSDLLIIRVSVKIENQKLFNTQIEVERCYCPDIRNRGNLDNFLIFHKLLNKILRIP